MSDLLALRQLVEKQRLEIARLEREIAPLASQLRVANERAETAAKLISLMEPKLEVGPPCDEEREFVEDRSTDSNNNVYTPTHVYWPATLRVLVEMGGSGRSEAVIDGVGQNLTNVLTPADHDRLASGVVRWRNRVAWQRANMVSDGLIRKGSPRGIWEITNAGREWLRKFQADLSAEA